MISPTYVDSILRDLHRLWEDPRLTHHMWNQIQILEYELEPLKIYFLCLAKWNDASEKEKFNCRNKRSGFFSHRNKKYLGFGKELLIEAKKKLLKTGFEALDDGEFEDWNTLASDLLEISQHCKPKITEDCLHSIDSSFKGLFPENELNIFMGNILKSLCNLLNFKANMILDVKVKIESLKEKLDLFKEVLDFTLKCCNSREALEDFKIHTQSWVWKAAWLSLLCWTLDETEEKMEPTLNAIFLNIRQRINPSTAEVTRMYLAVLKASRPPLVKIFGNFPSQGSVLQTKRMVVKYVEFLLENLLIDLQNDGIPMLHRGLLFLIAFLMYPPKEEKYTEVAQLILTQVDAVINEAPGLISSLSADQLDDGSTEEKNSLLLDFVGKANLIKAEVRKLYAHSLLHESSDFNFPMINVLSLFESVVENCKVISKSFPMDDIMTVREDLLSILPFLKLSNLRKFQNEHKELKDFWTRIINVAYQAERALSSFIHMSNPIWQDMLCLSDVIEQMKFVKGEIKMIEDQHMHNTDAFNVESCSSAIIPLQVRTPRMDEVVVGFDDKVKEILDRLLGGSTERDIVLIVGMPGIGKTTLAKKVYDDISIGYHFNRSAWCTVSQAYDSKRLFLDILTGLGEPNFDFSKLKEEDLPETLYKRLKGQKYLIVMDDIWDSGAWNSIKVSFPDDNNGSRILMTSRICNVVLEEKSNYSPFPLSPLSDKDSWHLLKMKLFYRDSCPQNFVWIGKQIAKNCKWLPLAIVLVAALLKEKIENLDWWKEIRDSLGSLIAKQSSMDLLELSYKHLPNFLKPCFLYFGSFPEDQEIRVQKLIQLWVSEGFILKHEKKSLEVVAKEYLMDLVARSLVIVSKRSSIGGMKTCRIHDLLRDFCLVKSEQEKFLKVVDRNISRGCISWAAIFNNYRVCIQGPYYIFSLSWISSAQFVHTLLTFGNDQGISKGSLINLIFLRVLALEGLSFDHFPEEVTDLVLLRYLEIRFCGSIPEAIERLQSLETLHLHGDGRSYLPLTMWGMEKLRQVDVGFVYIPNFSGDLPSLDNMQMISSPYLDHREKAEMFLRRIPTIKKLSCHCGQIPKFDFLSLLESLNVTHVGDRFHTFECYFPATLKKLTLRNFKLAWTDISAIGKLPNLEVLKLIGNSIDGKTWNVEDTEFLKLKFLKLQPFNIQKWNVSNDAFPCLECLVLVYCNALEGMPSAFANIPTLNMLEVLSSSSTVQRSAMQIKEDQHELGNVDLEVLIHTKDQLCVNSVGCSNHPIYGGFFKRSSSRL